MWRVWILNYNHATYLTEIQTMMYSYFSVFQISAFHCSTYMYLLTLLRRRGWTFQQIPKWDDHSDRRLPKCPKIDFFKYLNQLDSPCDQSFKSAMTVHCLTVCSRTVHPWLVHHYTVFIPIFSFTHSTKQQSTTGFSDELSSDEMSSNELS